MQPRYKSFIIKKLHYIFIVISVLICVSCGSNDLPATAETSSRENDKDLSTGSEGYLSAKQIVDTYTAKVKACKSVKEFEALGKEFGTEGEAWLHKYDLENNLSVAEQKKLEIIGYDFIKLLKRRHYELLEEEELAKFEESNINY